MRRIRSGTIALSIALGDEPPREFRIFVRGWNDTEHGRFLFDDAAASAVMASYQKHGVDRMIDLEHLSLDTESKSFDPDARGWCRLDLRNGELWAVDVSWTPDGERRLREKTQRYVSPVFDVDLESKRITKVFNIAITAMPATHGTPHLVAASEGSMTMEELTKIAEALDMGPDATLEDVLAKIAAMVKAVSDATNGDAPPADKGDAIEVAADKTEDEEKKAEVMAAASRLMRLSNRSTLLEALVEAETWRESHIALDAERKKLSAQREALELGERKKLVADLVKLGAETPATAWEDATKSALKPCKRLMGEAVEDMRKRVAALSAARGNKPVPNAPAAPSAPADGGAEVNVRGTIVRLSAREVAICAERNTDVAIYAANKLASGRATA